LFTPVLKVLLSMKLEQKGSYDDDKPQNPRIKENYYDTELKEIVTHPRDGDAHGLILKFKVLDDVEVTNEFDTEVTDGDVVIPFFAPAKLSYSADANNSRLSDNLIKVGLHKPILEEIGIFDEVMKNNQRALWGEDSVGELVDVLEAFFSDKVVNVDIADSREGDESQVNKFSELLNGEEDDSDQDVILDGSESE
jgi:hypothetical protein